MWPYFCTTPLLKTKVVFRNLALLNVALFLYVVVNVRVNVGAHEGANTQSWARTRGVNLGVNVGAHDGANARS